MFHSRRVLAPLVLLVPLAGCASRGASVDSSAARADGGPPPRAAAAPVDSAAARGASPSSRIPLPFRARGNEPGWSLDVGERELTLVADYGDRRVTAPTPTATTSGDTTRWAVRAQGHDVVVTVVDRLCHDGMSEFPFPRTVTVMLDGRELRGCGGESAEVLVAQDWFVHEIDGVRFPERSRPVLAFGTNGRVSGRAPCNRFSGGYTQRGDELSFSQLASTRMACAPEVMELEQRFLARLDAVRRFERRADTLLLHTDDGHTLTARR